MTETELDESRTLVAMLQAMRRGDQKRCMELLEMVRDPHAFITTNLAFSVRILEVVDALNEMLPGDFSADSFLAGIQASMAQDSGK